MIASFFINILLLTIAVVIHYEILRALSVTVPKLNIKNRLRVIFGVFGTICAHIIEIWLFGIAFYLMVNFGDFGSLEGNFNGSLIDCVYFSFTNYTTVGYGDIEPFGHIRFTAGMEAIAGLSLITWSASFMFMEMTQFWENDKKQRDSE
ncbi:MAG: potassium channel family protein [Gammaproteobacteria bacterium]